MHHNTPSKPKPACAICGAPADAIVLGKVVCAPCYLRAEDNDVRLYRLSLKVVRGGLPG